MRRSRLALALLLPVLACRPGAPAAESGVAWSGAATGRAAGPATATWCADRQVLLLTLVAGDSGAALLFRPDSSAGLAGRYPVRPEGDTLPPPAAQAALRRYADRSVQGYRAVEGTALLEEAAPGWWAEVEATLLGEAGDTVRLTGRLRAPPADTEAACTGPAGEG